MNIYETCPTFESERFKIRLFNRDDCDDLLNVYSDKNALPFFNSDNCDGDNFYYATKERMLKVIDFWKMAYREGWFARLSIVAKSTEQVIGTVELCLRISQDQFNNMAILRVDVHSDFETESVLSEIFCAIAPRLNEIFGCNGVITKVPIYAIERLSAAKNAGFEKSPHCLIGKNGLSYDGYWTLK